MYFNLICLIGFLFLTPKIVYAQNIKASLLRMSHNINTSANEYLPVPAADGTGLYFSAMDRTGYFDFKIDFTKAKNAGGEDIYFSKFNNGIFEDARPLTFLNTNSHEVVTYSFSNGSLLVTGNYSENIGPGINSSIEGAQTTDVFKAQKTKSGYQIFHYPEPLNSVFSEFDAISNFNESFILFSSDRPGNVGAYHKKGWFWNENYFGNTDIYIAFRDGYEWTVPVNLGKKINTPYAERTPWLSDDLKYLYLSSNGYKPGKSDLDIYYFVRKDINNWTDWEGPFTLKDINSDQDDWGYKISSTSFQYLARASSLTYESSQKGLNGGFRETNFRQIGRAHV